jgi:hypothetical protein
MVLCLIDQLPLIHAWERCQFWTLPYYLVGIAAAALMISASQASGWYSSMLILPAIAVVYNSYRLHLANVT